MFFWLSLMHSNIQKTAENTRISNIKMKTQWSAVSFFSTGLLLFTPFWAVMCINKLHAKSLCQYWCLYVLNIWKTNPLSRASLIRNWQLVLMTTNTFYYYNCNPFITGDAVQFIQSSSYLWVCELWGQPEWSPPHSLWSEKTRVWHALMSPDWFEFILLNSLWKWKQA